MRATLGRIGAVVVIETRCNAFRGSRNFDYRPIHVVEPSFVAEERECGIGPALDAMAARLRDDRSR